MFRTPQKKNSETLSSETVTLIKCPYCDNWTQDTELVCNSCTPALKIDLALADIASAIENLEEEDTLNIWTRLAVLENLTNRLNTLTESVNQHAEGS